MIKKIGGWGNFILVFLFLFFLVRGLIRSCNLHNKAHFVYGVSEGIKKGVRGNLRLYYHFVVNGVKYTGRVPDAFCKECIKCCEIGDSVIVRYVRDNPENNDLVTSMPNN